MAITHTWSIQNLRQLNDGTGTVCDVHFSVDSVDGEFHVDSGDVVSLNTENIENFVSYENLTEEMVINWVKQTLGQDADNLESNHTYWIEQAKNPPKPTVISTPLPWAN